MTDSTPAPAPTPTQPEAPEDRRTRLLWRLFDLLLAALVRAVESPNAKASLLEVARQLLRDNNIRSDGRVGIRDGLAKLADRRGLKLPFDA
jgi:hypothetical protein